MGEAARKLKALGERGRAQMRERYPREFALLAWEAHRERGREDFWYFSKSVLRNPVLFEPLHRPLCQSLHARWPKERKLFLLPRGHIKSNLITIGYSLWRIVKNPNIRILISSHTADDAAGFAGGIKKIIDSAEFKETYPEIRPSTRDGKELKWRDDEFLVERSSTLKESTVETASVGVKKTGHHYELIVGDDMVTEKSTSADALNKAEECWKYVTPLLDPGGKIILTGTRYNYGDLYGREMNGAADDYDVTVRRAVENGAPIFPTRFHLGPEHEGDPENGETGRFSLPKLKQKLGPYIYACQYENDPINEETAIFKREQLQIISGLPRGRNFTFLRVCDLSTERETRSKTALVTVAIDDLANIYIVHIFHGLYDPSAIIAELIRGQRVSEEQRPRKVCFEKAMYERVLKHFIDKEIGRTGTFIPIVELPGVEGQKSKPARIRGMEPWVAGGKFFILETCPHRDRCIEQFARFPHAVDDMDIADAIAQAPKVMWPAGAPEDMPSEEQKQYEQHKEWFERQFGEPFELDDAGAKFIGRLNVMRPDEVNAFYSRLFAKAAA